MGEHIAQILPSPSRHQWNGKAISSLTPALIIEVRTSAEGIVSTAHPSCSYSGVSTGLRSVSPGWQPLSQQGTKGTAAPVALGKAGSDGHSELSPPSPTSWGSHWPQPDADTLSLALGQPGPGMCPLKDKTVPSFSHSAAICAPSVPADAARAGMVPSHAKAPQSPRGPWTPLPVLPLPVFAISA